MAVPVGTPNWFERLSGLWSVATVTSGTPPCACAGEQKNSAMTAANRYAQINLRTKARDFLNRFGREQRWLGIGLHPTWMRSLRERGGIVPQECYWKLNL